MRSVISLILVYCLAITSVFAQSVNPNDTLKIGKASSSSDKGLTFDTNDGVSNKKLLIEKVSKKLKWNGNAVQIGDGSPTSDKEVIIAGALKSLKYNGTTGEFEFNDDLKISGALKTDLLTAISAELVVSSPLRAQSGIKIGAGANELRVNAGNLEFSNDGSLYKKIGSGSGSGGSSGTNLVVNDSFEDGIGSPWTSTGGTLSQQTYAIGTEGDLKYGRFIAAGVGEYVEQIVSVPSNFSAGCQADFKKVNIATAGLFKIQALDVSNNVLAEQTIGVSAWIKVPTISFPCPVAGTMVKLRLISLAAGTIDFDKGYFGSNQNLVYSSQARLLGSVVITGCATYFSTSSTSFVDFGTQAGCIYSASGSALAPLTNIPAIRFASLPAGDYRLEFDGRGESSSSGVVASYQFSDGSNTAREMSVAVGSASATSTATISQSISYATTQTNVTLAIKGKVSSGSNYLYGTTTQPGVIKVWYYPSSSEVAVSNEQSSWFIDANIGGQNIGLALSNQSSYVPINDTGIDLVVNSLKGSSNVEIACSTGFSSIGPNCGANSENLGIAFVPPSAGLYDVCFDYGAFVDTGSNGEIDTTFQLVETPNNSLTIIQEGGSRMTNSTYNSDRSANAMHVCGTFNFSDTSKRTIRLMYEQALGGVITTNSIRADRLGTNGQRDIYVTVRPLLSAYSRPILTGNQTVVPGLAAGKNVDTFSLNYGTGSNTTVCSASPCSYLDQIGNAVSSVIRGSAGSYVLNFNRTYSKLKCSISGHSGGATMIIAPPIECSSACSSKSFATWRSTDGVNTDTYGTIMCQGEY